MLLLAPSCLPVALAVAMGPHSKKLAWPPARSARGCQGGATEPLTSSVHGTSENHSHDCNNNHTGQ